MKKAVLLLSGGLDSAANLILGPHSPKQPFDVKVALSVDYGQNSAERELGTAKALCESFKIRHIAYDLKQYATLISKKSALLGRENIPNLPHEDLDDIEKATQTANKVWVPNRNGLLINLAAGLAEAEGLGAVAVGFNREEAVTFPDNSREFMGAMDKSLSFSTQNQVSVVSATVELSKKEIVTQLIKMDFPFTKLWSCYRKEEKHCGRCESCNRLKRALTEGIKQESTRDSILRSLFDI